MKPRKHFQYQTDRRLHGYRLIAPVQILSASCIELWRFQPDKVGGDELRGYKSSGRKKRKPLPTCSRLAHRDNELAPLVHEFSVETEFVKRFRSQREQQCQFLLVRLSPRLRRTRSQAEL